MSNRRHSVAKLSRKLRILEDDLVVFLHKNGLIPKQNIHGYSGYDPEELKSFFESMETFSKNEMFLLKTKWESEQEKTRNQTPLEDYCSLEEAAQIFEAPLNKLQKFLENNNVPKVIKNGYVFWDAVTILRIKESPSKKQFIDINKLKKAKTQEINLNDIELSEMLNIDTSLVPSMKRFLGIENLFPLTKDVILDIVSSYDYQDRRTKFLGKENRKKTNPIFVPQITAETELINGIPADKMFTANNASDMLGISISSFRKYLKDNNISPDSFYTNDHKNKINLFSYKTINMLEETERIQSMKLRSSKAKDKIKKKQNAILSEKETITTSVSDKVQVNIPLRQNAPYSATIYVGPTNSGKTYNSLNALFEEYEENVSLGQGGKFVYAGPLRMLAYEVYVKMCERYGKDKVGFLTGEEQINPDAQLIAATAEMAPKEGHSLVLDEAHWIIEPERGNNWTQLLAGAEYKNFHILTAAEAKETILNLVSDAYNVEEKHFTRKTPIYFEGKVEVENLKPKTAVICFSRKMVYKVAQTLKEQSNYNVSVLYGALPLMVREKQINDFIKGNIDIIVTTDVIGHGINLPLDSIVYTETTKFDGSERRDLHLWEAAQISGRAGRYGLSPKGSVQILNLGWNKTEYSLVSDSALAAGGNLNTQLVADNALIAPKLSDLNINESEKMMLALEQWENKATEATSSLPFTPSALREKKKLLEVIGSTLSAPIYPWDKKKDERDYTQGLKFGEKKHLYPQGRALNGWNIKSEELWQLISGPYDPELPTVKLVAQWLQEKKVSPKVKDFFEQNLIERAEISEDIEELEKISRIISELKMTNVIFPEINIDHNMLNRYETLAGNKIIEILETDKAEINEGVCQKCGQNCNAWFVYCKSCSKEQKVFA